ncbi:pyrrolidone-carboxylate peptidase [Rheinheimera sp. KL1]|uniref:pyroglutamyl-peptidase I n=1 Tax=Rheinheimera sp. KL1 TaxID=1635005 RepID=UPI0006A95A00|nr:pyroglutamyl-peptidase I [Rheinheimera sp. KL1]KOO59053.1 pyrrolidone-carboxylate peptidase [Rheinheimera sp. KL1]
MHTILLTGFEPFGGEQSNPSWLAVQQLDGYQLDDEVQIVSRQLSCVFEKSQQELKTAIAELKPVLVLALGQAGGRTELCFEKVAINFIDARIADNAGQQPVGAPVVGEGPAAYFTTLPIKAMVNRLKQQGIPAAVSYTAGTYVCNTVFYALMHQLKDQSKVRAGFLHIPYAPEQAIDKAVASMPVDMVVRALKLCLPVALQSSEDLQIVAGTLD